MFGNDERAGPAQRPEMTVFAVPLLVYFFGRIVRSAIARNVRAISTGSPLSPSFAAPSSTSCCTQRTSASMISTARSFWLRLVSPAVRYQTETARALGFMDAHHSKAVHAD